MAVNTLHNHNTHIRPVWPQQLTTTNGLGTDGGGRACEDHEAYEPARYSGATLEINIST